MCSFDWGEGFNDFKCGTLVDRFQRVSTASMAVKGLIQKYKVWCGTLRFALYADAWVCVLLQGLVFFSCSFLNNCFVFL